MEGTIVYHCKIRAPTGNQKERQGKFDLSDADESDVTKFYNMREY